MQYQLPLQLCGSSIRSMPTFFHVSDTGIGCSMGEGLSNFLLLLWQISHRLTCIQHKFCLYLLCTPQYLYTKLTHKINVSYPVVHIIIDSLPVVSLWDFECSLVTSKVASSYSVIVAGFQDFGCQDAFEALKAVITRSPVLAYPNFDVIFVLGDWCLG